jgi:hypothetical protein
MMGGAKAHYDGIVAFSQTDFTEDLKKITIPVLVKHSEDDHCAMGRPCRRRSGPFAGHTVLHAKTIAGAMSQLGLLCDRPNTRASSS